MTKYAMRFASAPSRGTRPGRSAGSALPRPVAQESQRVRDDHQRAPLMGDDGAADADLARRGGHDQQHDDAERDGEARGTRS